MDLLKCCSLLLSCVSLSVSHQHQQTVISWEADERVDNRRRKLLNFANKTQWPFVTFRLFSKSIRASDIHLLRQVSRTTGFTG